MSADSEVDDAGVPGPPVVYLPVDVDTEGGIESVRMIRLPDGRVALLGYTALDRFLDCWGDQQPWALFETANLAALMQDKPFDIKMLDVPVPEHMRPSAPHVVPEPGSTGWT